MSVLADAVAVLAGHGQITDFGVRIGLAVRDLVDPDPVETVHLVRFIFSEGHIVLLVAGHHTGPASGALVQINDHAVAFGVFISVLFFHPNLIADC